MEVQENEAPAELSANFSWTSRLHLRVPPYRTFQTGEQARAGSPVRQPPHHGHSARKPLQERTLTAWPPTAFPFVCLISQSRDRRRKTEEAIAAAQEFARRIL